jgi:transcriptional regulator with XRE-family HTH domain
MAHNRDLVIEARRRQFRRWLKETRRRAGLTQDELSVKMDKSQSAITSWENVGLERMDPEEMQDLARALEVRPVEVAAALGYPTNVPAAPPITVPFSADEWMRHVAQLNERVQRETEQWAEEILPPEAGGRERNGRSG